MIINENGFNKIQINYSEDRASDGVLIKKSSMINIRTNDVKEAVQLYRQLQEKLGIEKNNRGQGKGKNENEKKAPLCPIHKTPMQLKSNRSNGNLFYGCVHWKPHGKGCNETLPYQPEKESVEVIDVEQVPF